MLLIGMFDSPFVRRVAVSMKLLGIGFEHANWSVGKDFDRIRQFNPLGRVPTLVLDDGDALSESATILDYLDDLVGQSRALLPPTGSDRRATLKLMSIAIGAAEKGRDQLYERVFRPADKRYEPWVERCRVQMHGALAELERCCVAGAAQQWLVGGKISQADITVTCAVTFLRESHQPADLPTRYPSLMTRVDRCEVRPDFKSTHEPYSAPSR
jgi:glutathione S-transferase